MSSATGPTFSTKIFSISNQDMNCFFTLLAFNTHMWFVAVSAFDSHMWFVAVSAFDSHMWFFLHCQLLILICGLLQCQLLIVICGLLQVQLLIVSCCCDGAVFVAALSSLHSAQRLLSGLQWQEGVEGDHKVSLPVL